MSAIGGLFNTPLRFRNPQLSGAPQMPPQGSTSSGQIMPPGSPAGDPAAQAPQNAFMPQGIPMGPVPQTQQTQTGIDPNAPTTQAAYTQRAPIMNPNNQYMLDTMKAGVLNPQATITTPGVSDSNNPQQNMRGIPFFMNQLLAGG